MSTDPVFEVVTADYERVYIRATSFEHAILYIVGTLHLTINSITVRSDLHVEVAI